MVPLEGVEKFGDYVRWANLFESDEVDAVHAVLKPKTRQYLKPVCEAHPVITAMRAYIESMVEVKTEEEFLALEESLEAARDKARQVSRGSVGLHR
jgi:hypothetical protein